MPANNCRYPPTPAAAAIPSARVTSVDGCRALVEHARSHAAGNVRFEVGDAQALSFALGFASFDDYWQPFLGGQGPAGGYAASLSDADRHAPESRLRRRLSAGRDGSFTLPARAWAVKGVVPAG